MPVAQVSDLRGCTGYHVGTVVLPGSDSAVE
jgi:hypothetical protein